MSYCPASRLCGCKDSDILRHTPHFFVIFFASRIKSMRFLPPTMTVQTLILYPLSTPLLYCHAPMVSANHPHYHPLNPFCAYPDCLHPLIFWRLKSFCNILCINTLHFQKSQNISKWHKNHKNFRSRCRRNDIDDNFKLSSRVRNILSYTFLPVYQIT